LGEARDRRRIPSEVGLQELQRDGLPEMDMLGLVDQAHAARTEHAIDAVLAREDLTLDEPARRE
jgi:hypothetical protein